MSMNNDTLMWAFFWLLMFVVLFAIAMLVRNRVAKTEPRRYSKADDVGMSVAPTPTQTSTPTSPPKNIHSPQNPKGPEL